MISRRSFIALASGLLVPEPTRVYSFIGGWALPSARQKFDEAARLAFGESLMMTNEVVGLVTRFFPAGMFDLEVSNPNGSSVSWGVCRRFVDGLPVEELASMLATKRPLWGEVPRAGRSP